MRSYAKAVQAEFGTTIDYGQIVKNYSKKPVRGKKKPPNPNKPFITRQVIIGNFNLDSICTSHVERFNNTLRNGSQRYTRRTLSFSKSLPNLEAAISLQIAYYNFCHVVRTIGTTPAVAAGIASEEYTIEKLIEEANLCAVPT
jgi:hypothetical protein